MAPSISDDLRKWADVAGYSSTPDDGSGAAIFWTDPGGEIRYYIRMAPNGSFILSSAERALPEQFELSGTSMAVVERHLFGVFGSDVRSRKGLARLIIPRRREQLAAGYTLDELDAEGYRCLSDSNGLVAKAQGRLSSITTLTKLSHLLSFALADVEASFEDPEGRPLFAAR